MSETLEALRSQHQRREALRAAWRLGTCFELVVKGRRWSFRSEPGDEFWVQPRPSEGYPAFLDAEQAFRRADDSEFIAFAKRFAVSHEQHAEAQQLDDTEGELPQWLTDAVLLEADRQGNGL